MAKKSQGLTEFLIEELRDLYDAEKQLVKALPRMAKAASNEELQGAINEHLEQTKGQVDRLEQCFELLGQTARSKPCTGMRGIIEESKEMMQEDMEDEVKDAAIASGGRKVEHYEIIAYESLRGIAEQLGQEDVAELLGETLEEEHEADRILTELCQRAVEESAQSAEPEEDTGEGETGEKGTRTSRRGGGTKRASTARGKSASASSRHSAQSRPLTDHDEIRQWAEQRDAEPSCVKGTMKGDTCLLRLDFPGYSGEESLEQMSWDQWFKVFDKRNLALLVQDETASGEQSNFNKLVDRRTVSERPKTRSAH